MPPACLSSMSWACAWQQPRGEAGSGAGPSPHVVMALRTVPQNEGPGTLRLPPKCVFTKWACKADEHQSTLCHTCGTVILDWQGTVAARFLPTSAARHRLGQAACVVEMARCSFRCMPGLRDGVVRNLASVWRLQHGAVCLQ